MGSERRKHRRVKAKDVAGHVRVKDEVLALGLPIDNISMGGLFVRCSNPLPAGTPVVLELTQPQMPRTLKLSGTARRAAGGMGVKFEALSEDSVQRLSDLLKSLVRAEKAKPVALAAPVHNPAQIDEHVEASRQAFDFHFVSLEELPEAPEKPAPAKPRTRTPAPAPLQVAENARLMVQVRGLLADLDETRLELERRSEEISTLRDENTRLREQLRVKSAELTELAMKLAQR